MEKFVKVFLLSGVIMFISCSDDSGPDSGEPDGGNPGEPIIELDTLKVFSSISYVSGTEQAVALLSDEDGRVVSRKELIANDYSYLTGNFDSINYDLTIAKVIPFDSMKFITAKTYADIPLGSYEIKSFSNENPANLQTNVILENPPDGIFELQGSNSFNQGPNGEMQFTQELDWIPESFFASFKDAFTDTFKYIFIEDVYGDDNYSVNYNALPVFDQTHIIRYPQNRDLGSVILGLRNERLYDHIPIHVATFIGSPQELEYRIPEGIFDSYYIITSIKKLEGTFLSHHIVPTVFSEYLLPDLDYTVEYSNGMISIESDSEFDFFHANLSWESDKESLLWEFVGESSMSSIMIPEIFDDIIIDDPMFSIQDLSTGGSKIVRAEGDEYQEYVKKEFDAKYKFNEITSIKVKHELQKY